MTVNDLMGVLKDLDPFTEVRLAFQPSWPLEYSLSQIVEPKSFAETCEVLKDDDGWHIEQDGEQLAGPFETLEAGQAALAEKAASEDLPNIVYIAEGEQIGYLPTAAARALGW